MFHNRGSTRSSQERIRCGFGRLSQAAMNTDDPFAGDYDLDTLFTPVIISQNSEATVCSEITMDKALEAPQPMEEEMTGHELHQYRAHQSSRGAVAFDQVITMPLSIQDKSIKKLSSMSYTLSDEGEHEQGGVTEEAKAPVKTAKTDSTFESSDEEGDGPWTFAIEEQATPIVESAESKRRSVSVVLEDFDFDHLTIFQGSVFGKDEDSSDDGEAWVVRRLERNASELYWLQLTTNISDPVRLIRSMEGNTSVRNVTVYPCAMESLSMMEQKLLVDAICQLRSLKNLIVFQACGSQFVDPLIRYRPPLTRLTLYKLDFSSETLLARLAVLLLGLPMLEELSLEKYRGVDGSKLLKVFSTVLPGLARLKSMSLTPARGVKLSSEGPRALFRALWQNNTVRSLSLQGSEESIDQPCINELMHALRLNTTLQKVKLTGFWKSDEAFWNRFTEKSRTQIRYHLKLNQSGIRNLQLDVNANYKTLRSVLVSHRDNLDHIYYLLLNNPSMLEV